MAIHFAKGPEAGLELVKQHVAGQDQQPQLDAVRPALEAGKISPITPLEAGKILNADRGAKIIPISKPLWSTEPYAVHTASRADLDQSFLKTARLTAWHYLLADQDDNVHSLVEVAVLGKGEGLSYAALRPRDYADMMVAAIEGARLRPEAEAQQYELRILRVPDLSFLGVWLHTEEQIHDLVIPILGSSPDYEANIVMTEGDLVKALRPIADRRRKADDRPKRPNP
jgi:hypothetical protein